MFQKLFCPIHASHGFYAAIWGSIAGIALAVFSEPGFATQSVWCVISVVIIICCFKFTSKFTTAIVFLAAVILGNFCANRSLPNQALLQSFYDQTVIISGKISEDPDDSQSTTVLRLQDLNIHKNILDTTENTPQPITSKTIQNPSNTTERQNEFTSLPGTLYVTISSKTPLERSDVVWLEGKFSEGFGTFAGKMSRPKLLHLERAESGDVFARFKRWFANLVKQFIPSPEVDLGLSYLMGMKSGLSTDFSEALRAVGMTHVVVASGAHLAILTGAAKKLFGRISKFAGMLFSLLMVGGFVLIVGFTPSMVRAALVASLSLLFGYIGRKFAPIRLIGLVASLTLLTNPTNLLNLGWQLSFASFFGILILAPILTKIFYGQKKPPWLATMLITSLATCLVCAPILVYNFGSISFLSFIANLVILPTLPYVMLGILLTGVTSFAPVIASVTAKCTILLLDLHIWLVEFLAEKTMFIIELPSGDPRIFLLYLPIFALIVLSQRQRKAHTNNQQKSAPHLSKHPEEQSVT